MVARVALTLFYSGTYLALWPLLSFGLLPTSRAGYLKVISLAPSDFMVATGSALRLYGLSSALWVDRPSGLSASPGRRT